MHRVGTCLAPCLRKRGHALRRGAVGTALGAIIGHGTGDALALDVTVDGFRFVNHRLAWTVAGALVSGLVAVCVGTKTPQPVGTFQHKLAASVNKVYCMRGKNFDQDVESPLPEGSEEKKELEKEYMFVDCLVSAACVRRCTGALY